MKKALLLGIFIMMYAGLLAQKSTSAGGTDNAAPHETHVTPAQALYVGYTFMRTGDGTKSGTVSKQAMQLVYTGQAFDSLTGTVTDCYYVFALQPKGFVIVAADDRVEPILGYSYDNDFAVADMPDHVRSWLNGYERQIETVAKNNFQPAPETQTKWTRLKSGQSMNSAKSDTSVGPLLTTTWDQGQYYNSLCPAPANASGPAGHVYAGCVATAMAQIIHYWGYPAHGRGTHSYSSDYGTLTVNYDSTNYNHTLMPNALTSSSTTDEVNAVAGLIRDCGVAANMWYSPTESSALDQNARAALINFYRFSSNLSFAEKAYFSESEWDAMLHADLDNNRPVYYSGHGSGGHAFVCDGYDADGYYHFNFGWGGFADGWFLTSSITPGGSNFNDSQAALFGIAPDSTGNVILGQTKGTSTFIVDEPLEFYHLMGHNAYEGGNYDNSCNHTVHFIPANTTNQIVADILDFEDQTLTLSDGDGNPLRSLVGGSDNDNSPVVSSHNALNIAYSGNMYYTGFKLSISQTDDNGCRMVSNITPAFESTTVHLTWAENGAATQWEIEYGVKGFALGTGTTYTATTNTVTINNLQPLTEYDFYIRSICDSTHYGLWNKTTLMVEGPYWQDIVTSEPAGYVYNAETNSVEISTAEQLAWWAKTGNGIDGHLAADIDLSGYRWQPTELSNRNFNGHGHVLSNVFIQETYQLGGFFSSCATGFVIEDLGIINAHIKSSLGCGGLCGSLKGVMKNCFIRNTIIDGSDMVGGLVSENDGLIINCYANADITGNRWTGLLAGSSSGAFRNCYAAGKLRIRMYCYNAGITATLLNGEISHCYSVRTNMGIVGLIASSTVTDTSTFVKSDYGCTFLSPVVFDDITETDLLSALNRGIDLYNDSAYRTWVADSGNINGGYPLFGNKHIVQCPNVTDISLQNITVNNNYAVSVSWTDNSDATQWRISYRRHDKPDTTFTCITTTNNPDTIFGLPLGYAYEFYVRAICGTNNLSGCNEYLTFIVDLPFWTDIVTTQPTGYVEDAAGNVEISSAEGLAWLAVKTNGFHGQQLNTFAGKTITLQADINLEGYRWYPIANDPWWYGFSGTFDGLNHQISNIYMNDDDGGLFGTVHQGRVKNVNLDGGLIICNGGGGLIETAYDCYEISNCHSSTTVYSKGRVGDGYFSGRAGALCGVVQCFSDKTIVSNCSASGTIYGIYACGDLIGRVWGNVVVRNCYATGDVNAYIDGISNESDYRGGLIGYFEQGASAFNCFSTGTVEIDICRSYGKVIGCSSLNTHIHYIYGQDDVNAGWDLTGNYCEDYSNSSEFHHDGSTNALLTPVSITGTTYSDLLDALNAWVISQNDSTLRLWTLDSISGYPVFGDYFVPSCHNPTDLIVSQATEVGDATIKTRLSWSQGGIPDHWEALYVAAGQSITSGNVGTIVSIQNNPCILAGIPVGQPLDFYVRAICGNGDTSGWCGPVTYLPDKLRWTEVVTSQPEGFQKDANGNVYISSAEGLSWLASVVNGLNGNSEYEYYIGHIILTNDIDLSTYRWTSIGRNLGCYLCSASFDGNHHVVSGLYCNELSDRQGLFGYMRGNVYNLTLTQCDVRGENYVGTIVGESHGNSIVNCSATGNVSGNRCVGGLVGSCTGCDIKNSYFIGNASALSRCCGGICGVSNNTILNCYVAGEIAVASYSGIITGYYFNLPFEVSNCYYKEYETSLPITDNSLTITINNSGFSGSGYIWTLSAPPYISGAFHHDLVDALNAWVDTNNTNGEYRHWIADTAMVNGGYPVFETISYTAVTTQDTVVVPGYYSWHGTVFTSDTVVTDTIPTFNGYDSVVTHHIIINPALLTEITVDTCSSYIWNGETYTKTGDYVQVFPSSGSGDSVVVLRLTINPLAGEDEHLICNNSYTWIDGVTYVANNHMATYTLQTADGCDSVVTLHLTFGSNTGDTTAVACDSFDWYEHTNLTQSGDYTRTVTNTNGCDSIVTLHLTINHPVAELVEATVYDSYVWDSDTLTESGDYTRTFTASNGCDSVVTLHLTVNYTTPPTVTTCTVSDITAYSAISGGTVTADGGAEVTERGVCWSTSQEPTIADSYTTDGSGTGAFTSQLTSLEPNTTYYVRAYATNSKGTAYGEERMFTTLLSFTCGEDLIVDNNSYTTMNYGSQCWMTQNLRNDSGSEYFSWAAAKLACPNGWHMPTVGEWETLANYVDNNSTQDSNIPLFFAQPSHGSFWVDYPTPWGDITYVITCETSGQTISVNTYVYYEANETGSQVLTRCLRNENAFAALPTVTTDTVSNITPNTATCGGNVTADGGATITARGVCWSTSQNPTVSDSHTTDGSGAGTFTCQLSDLELDITYHVRAYATNSAGTAYGEEVTFTTGCNPVDVTITSDKVAICEGECATLHASGANSYIWSTGENINNLTDCPTVTTTYSVTGFDLYGCESAASFTLMVNDLPTVPIVMVENDTVCDGGEVSLSISNLDSNPSTSYTWNRNGVMIPGATQAIIVDNPTTVGGETTNYVYTVVASYGNSGCVSGISEPTVVTVKVTNHTELFETVCNSYEWNDSVYIQTGDYTQTFTNASGCDSVVTLHLTVFPADSADFAETACESFTWGGTTYTSSGDYTKTFTNANGCDSVVTLHLTVNYSNTGDTTAVVCDSFDWHEQTNLTQSGDYTRTVSNAAGCDSIVTLHLTINHPVAELVEATACDSYSWNDFVYIQSGDYTQTFTAANGCDSVVSLHLTVNYSNSGDTTAVACDRFDWHEQTNITQSGDYTRTVSNAAGCDSIVTLHLTINSSVTEFVEATACDSYSWNDYVYTQSGDYTQTFTAANGCDSVVTLHLTVKYSNSGDTTAVACDSFDWHEQTNLTQSGNYTRTVSNAAGCDSVVTLHLTINSSVAELVEATTCDSYSWNDYVYTQSGDYTQTFTAANGCDSVVTLHLIVNYSNTGDTTALANDRFDWYEHTYLTMSGDYTHVFTNQSGCDSVVTLHLTVSNPTITIQDTVMTDGYFIWHGMVFTSDTVLTETIPVLDGYDSVIIYHVFVTPTPLTVLTVDTCVSYTLNGQIYTETGNYVQTFPIPGGIDSVVVLYLTIFPADSADFSETACEFFTWEGITYTTSGDYTQIFSNANGCDSVVTLHLTLFPADSADFAETACEFFTWEGITYTTSGDYTQIFSNANGCDSVVTLHLTLFPADSADFAETACESFTWEGTTYTTSGDYTKTFSNANGCDSVVTLHLTIFPADSADFAETACESFTWEGTTYTTSGDYTQIFTNVNGCDSVVTLHLTIFPADSADFAETACEFFIWEGTTYTTSGDYTQIFSNVNGCDSVVTLHLTIFPADSADFAETACDSFTWEGTTYTTSGDYTQIFTNVNGCDSVVTLHLTLFPADSADFTETACEFFTWEGTTYTTSGDYTQIFTNVNGCDSVVTLHLTIFPADSADFAETACEFFTWEGITYTASGDYTQIFTNVNGCDSVVTLHLTINYSNSGDTTAVACDSFDWYEQTNLTQSGDYTRTITNAAGCDSVVTLHLTVNAMETSEFTITTSDSCYTWNSETYCTSGDYTQTLQTIDGCDSVVTLHLTVSVGIDDHNDFAFNLYPNPTNGIVIIQFTHHNSPITHIHVFDAYGKLVGVVETNAHDSSVQTAQIDLSGFAAGVYFVKAVAEGNVVAVRKVVKR